MYLISLIINTIDKPVTSPTMKHSILPDGRLSTVLAASRRCNESSSSLNPATTACKESQWAVTTTVSPRIPTVAVACPCLFA